MTGCFTSTFRKELFYFLKYLSISVCLYFRFNFLNYLYFSFAFPRHLRLMASGSWDSLPLLIFVTTADLLQQRGRNEKHFTHIFYDTLHHIKKIQIPCALTCIVRNKTHSVLLSAVIMMGFSYFSAETELPRGGSILTSGYSYLLNTSICWCQNPSSECRQQYLKPSFKRLITTNQNCNWQQTETHKWKW